LFKVVSVDAHRYPPTVEPDILAEAGARLEAFHCRSEKEVIAVTEDADALLVSLTRVTREIVESWKKMKVVARLGVGVDAVDLEAATECGIMVTNVPDFCTEEVADTALGMILMLERKLHWMDRLVRLGTYNRLSAAPLHRLRGRTLGIVGFGRIGKALTRRAIPLGYKLLTCDPYLDPDEWRHYPVEFTTLEQLLTLSDVVSLHVPLTGETRRMISVDQLRIMKPEAILINTARGAVVDQPALYEALSSGSLRGAGLDVLEKEPPDTDEPLLSLPNVIFTPHFGSYSEESHEEVRVKACRQIVQALKGQVPSCLVNHEVLPKLRP
jgi:D-3-phosphoglycerate dehydrogenase / 2-oxoglutarate reductase